MKPILVAGATALFLLFGAVVPALAQDDHHDQEAKPEQKAQEPKPAQHEEQAKPAQHEEQAKTEKQPQESKPAQRQDQPKAAKEEKQAKPQQQEQQAKSAKQDEQKQARGQQEQANANHEQGQQHRQRTADEQRSQREQPALRLSARSESRIPDDRFRSNFGRNHEFRMGSPRIVDGYSRFQYGGYWFGFAQAWPDGWYYTDDVYVDYIDGGYYLCNPYYPGQRVSIIVVL